jgi:hypothetical protein
MTIAEDIEREHVDNLYLDPLNGRLGRGNTGPKVTQEAIRDLMKEWELEELGASFLESGFWPQEALIVVVEELYGAKRNVVVEGNRRLAALKSLWDAFNKKPPSKKWKALIEAKPPKENLFARVPYLKVSSRKDVEAFIGFRHVTGIKEWHPAEKAEYIAKLIEERGMGYDEVMRKIGSKTPAVRQHYISYRLLLQMEDRDEISIEHVEDKFSVLYLSLRTDGVQTYLEIDIQADPKTARSPVPKAKLKQLANFAMWLFGNDEKPPLFTDSRRIDDFGRILASKKAVTYLERTEKPSFEVAYRTAGGDEPETIRLVEQAAENVELALGKAHFYSKSEKLQIAVERLGLDVDQLLTVFPTVQGKIAKESE